MIFRFSAKLGKKLKFPPTDSLPAHKNPYADWSAHLFVADRTQYILVTNTASLYSVLMFGRGNTDEGSFFTLAFQQIGEAMKDDGYEFLRERFFVPETASVSVSKALNRSVIGSMNDMVANAEFLLTEHELSPHEVALQLNKMPMSMLDYAFPREAFGNMKVNQ